MATATVMMPCVAGGIERSRPATEGITLVPGDILELARQVNAATGVRLEMVETTALLGEQGFKLWVDKPWRVGAVVERGGKKVTVPLYELEKNEIPGFFATYLEVPNRGGLYHLEMKAGVEVLLIMEGQGVASQWAAIGVSD